MSSTDQQDQIRSLYGELSKAAKESNPNWTRILKLSNKVLGLNQTDEFGLHSKVICLIRIDKFAEASRLISQKSLKNCEFLMAYILYRLGDYEQALRILGDHDNDTKQRILNAQLLYRLERYEESCSILRGVYSVYKGDYRNELTANYYASLWGSLNINNDFSSPELKEDKSINSYEILYNESCVSIAKRQFKKAEVKLKQAEENLKKFTNETDSSIQLDYIRAQLAFALQHQASKQHLALDIYHNVLNSKPSDNVLICSINANILIYSMMKSASNRLDSTNLRLLKKRLKALQSAAIESNQKLPEPLLNVILFNEAILALENKNFNDYQDLTLRLKQNGTSKSFEVHLNQLKIAALILQRKYDEALCFLEEAHNGKVQLAIGKKENDWERVHISTLTSNVLFLKGEKSKAFDALVECFDDIPSPYNIEFSDNLLNCLSDLYTQLGTPNADQKSSFDKILRTLIENTGSPAAVSMFIELNSSDLDTAITYLQKQQITTSNDSKEKDWAAIANEVEQAFNNRIIRAGMEGTDEVGNRMDTAKVQKSKKRRRRKYIVPENAPPLDPERWLPLTERSYYRGGRRKKKVASAGKATQGTSAPEAAHWIGSGGAQPNASPPIGKTSFGQRQAARKRRKQQSTKH
ncbi:hypothetical protein ACOME3_008130 [Neoechinorhynchus agilis]